VAAPITVQAAAPSDSASGLRNPKNQSRVESALGCGEYYFSDTHKGAWNVRYCFKPRMTEPMFLPPRPGMPRGNRQTFLKRETFMPREYLLSALGQASKLVARVERSLKPQMPGALRWTQQARTNFCKSRRGYWAGGFGVMLPPWWTRKAPN